MSELAYPLPEIGEASLSADPRTLEALINIKAWAAGQIDSTNLKALGISEASLKAESVSEAKLTAAVAELLNNKTAGGETKKSIIATEQTRENTAYGTLATPDEVTVVVPTNGLIMVNFLATWQESVSGAGRAALFLGSNQVVAAMLAGTGGASQSAAVTNAATSATWRMLTSCGLGLGSSGPGHEYSGEVTTGQVLGSGSAEGAGSLFARIEGTGATATPVQGGSCVIFAAAGSYKLSVQYKSTSGAVKVKNRKLWALAIA